MEIAALEMRLKALNKRAGLTEDSVEDTALANAQLRESLHHQQLSLATAQSVVSGLLVRHSFSLFPFTSVLLYHTCVWLTDGASPRRTASTQTRSERPSILVQTGRSVAARSRH